MIPKGGARTLGGPKGRDQGRSGSARGGPLGGGARGAWGPRGGDGGGARGRSGGARPVPPERELPAGNGRQGAGREGKEGGLNYFL